MTAPLFNDVQDTTLRTWNRCSVAFNLASDKGPEASQRYMEKFPENAQKQMLVMFKYIEAKGYENVKREVNRGAQSSGTLEA